MVLLPKEYTTRTETDHPSIPPVVREYPADMETPVTVYLKLAGKDPSFLLESITGGEQLARYSFIGIQPARSYVIWGKNIHSTGRDGVIEEIKTGPSEDPLDCLRAELNRFRSGSLPGLPRFSGGLAGYIGYEMIRFFEPSVPVCPSNELPDGIFLLTDTVVAFDHAFGKLLLIAVVRKDCNSSAEALAEANSRLDAIEALLEKPVAPQVSESDQAESEALQAMVSPEEYKTMVRAAKEHIAAGDIFQVVLSQHMQRETKVAPFEIYRALRRLNPSPYMFFFNFGNLAGEPGLCLIGASPELNVRLEGKQATIRPIAGTRPRGKTSEEDAALEQEMLADPKELAEHVMLVDLARNDLGRACRYGSVRVTEQMGVERYSHVMHIVSQVVGTLREELDAFDLARVTFPAGTVSGAPKIRAMQIIQNLEKLARGPYAGAVGYFGFDGSLDTCIAIRTLVMRGQTVRIQAGAGIVADLDPANEYLETMNKARALALAIEMAEKDSRRL